MWHQRQPVEDFWIACFSSIEFGVRLLAHSRPLPTKLSTHKSPHDAFNQQERISLAITHDRRSLEQRYPKISRLAVLLATVEGNCGRCV
jgi:hypothetical protein